MVELNKTLGNNVIKEEPREYILNKKSGSTLTVKPLSPEKQKEIEEKQKQQTPLGFVRNTVTNDLIPCDPEMTEFKLEDDDEQQDTQQPKKRKFELRR